MIINYDEGVEDCLCIGERESSAAHGTRVP